MTDLAAIADWHSCVEAKIEGPGGKKHTLEFDIPTGDEGKKLQAFLISNRAAEGESKEDSIKRGLNILPDMVQWFGKLLRGADKLSAAQIEHIAKGLGTRSIIRILNECAGFTEKDEADSLSADSS